MEAGGTAPTGWRTCQVVSKVVESKALEVERKKRKKRGATKLKAPTVVMASPIETSFEVPSDNSESPSLVAKKKAKLLETTTADVEKVKERLKLGIHGGK